MKKAWVVRMPWDYDDPEQGSRIEVVEAETEDDAQALVAEIMADELSDSDDSEEAEAERLARFTDEWRGVEILSAEREADWLLPYASLKSLQCEALARGFNLTPKED